MTIRAATTPPIALQATGRAPQPPAGSPSLTLPAGPAAPASRTVGPSEATPAGRQGSWLPIPPFRRAIAPDDGQQLPRVVAHRGYIEDGGTGNTMDDFRRAADAGADAIELDVRRLRDDTLVVFHDARIGITPLSVMDAHTLRRRSGIDVPTLDEVVSFARERSMPVNIELKEPGYEQLVLDRVLDQLDAANVTVMSFDDNAVRKVKELRPEVRAGLLLHQLPITRLIQQRVWPRFPIVEAWRSKADFLAVHDSLANEQLIADSHRAGLPLAVWTVNEPADLERLMRDHRIDQVITDRPALAKAIREGVTPPAPRDAGT